MTTTADHDWVTLATRGASGALDAWDEYLMARPASSGLLLNVFAHQWLGEVPDHWCDEDGELLPMHCSDDGDVRLPEVFYGSQVVDCLDGGFIGGLQPTQDNAEAALRLVSFGAVCDALQFLEWDTGDTAVVLQALEVMRTT